MCEPGLLTVSVHPHGRGLRVQVSGEIDLASIPVLHEALDALWVDRPPAALYLDLRDVTFIGSIGLAALLATHQRCAARDVPYIVHPNKVVRRILTAAGLHTIIHAQGANPTGLGHRDHSSEPIRTV